MPDTNDQKQRGQFFEKLKRYENIDLENMLYRMPLTYHGNIKRLDIKHFGATALGYSLPPELFRIKKNIFRIISLLPSGVKVNVTIDDIIMKTNLSNSSTSTIQIDPCIKFTNEFFYCSLGFKFRRSMALSKRNQEPIYQRKLSTVLI